MDPEAHAPKADTSSPASAAPRRRFSFFVAPTFLALAAWFVFGPELTSVPAAATPAFDRATLTVASLRKIGQDTDPPTIHLHGFDRTCMDCHRTFSNPDPRVIRLAQHSHIQLQHGINTHCYHCHDPQDRNLLRGRDNETLPFTQVDQLCSQCHGTIHREWLDGMHGKRLGHWDGARGPQTRIVCTGCHDPHWPSRPAMSGTAPLSGPHTLRMGAATPMDEHPDPAGEDPLLRALNGTRAGH